MSIISIGIPIPDRSALPGQTGDGNEVNLQYATQNYCDGTGIFTPTVATPAGGVFTDNSSDPNLFQVNSTTGVFNLGVSDPGNYIVTYTVAGIGSANFPINISALDDASFSYSASAFCADASDQTPTIATPGGAFTAQDITFRPFQMQFSVTSGASKTITIPATVGSSYTVDWGDGTTTTESTGNISHTYDGSYPNPTVSIGAASDSGAFTFCSFNGNSTANDLIDIKSWGSIVWSDFLRVFKGCGNLINITATDAPDLSSCNRLSGAFYQASLSNVTSLNNWDVSTIDSLSTTFFWGDFNANITSWDVSNVTSMSSTFAGVGTGVNSVPFNQDISGWDVSSCVNFDSTFQYATSFNQNLSDWTLNNSLTTMNRIFSITNMSTENFTDTIVGWAVSIYNNSGLPSAGGMTLQKSRSFDGTRTSDDASGQTYAAKYGSDWTATGWTNSEDAFDYLTTTLSWTISF